MILEEKFIKKIDLIKSNYEELIEHLKMIRDKQCAHTDIAELNITLHFKDIESLIKEIVVWFEELSKFFDYGPSFEKIESEAKNTFKFLLKDLQIGKK